ncbi:DUF6241 domain-containing protein [Microbacteriaceae bacterium 4G12]
MNRRKKFLLIAIIIVSITIFSGYMIEKFLNRSNQPKQVSTEFKGEEIDDVANSEGVIIDSMHKMLHQKVLAPEKKDFIAMSPENIKKLIRILEESDKLTNRDEYLNILGKWEKGDFSQAVEEHNFVWQRAGGEVGKAYQLANKEQEQAFIQEQSKSKK